MQWKAGRYNELLVNRRRQWRRADLIRPVTIALVAASLFCQTQGAVAQTEAPASSTDEPAATTPKAAKLAQEFNDPLTTLPQVFVQEAYTPENYGTKAETSRLRLQLIVPRIPRFSLFPLVQLVRPSISLVTVPEGKGSATRTEFGDMALFDLTVIPWPGEGSGLLMGIGPVFVFPTATYKTAGQESWQVGPAFGAIYKGIPGVLLGGLIQNPISFAYTNDTTQPLSTLLIQPIVLKQVWRGLYVKSSDTTWTIGERAGSPTLLPLGIGLGYVIPREGAPPLNLSVTGEWMAYRENAPVASQTTVRFNMTVAFPEWTRWKGF
jgi:hypothetical protein